MGHRVLVSTQDDALRLLQPAKEVCANAARPFPRPRAARGSPSLSPLRISYGLEDVVVGMYAVCIFVY